jgi:hypothetical protein
VQIRKFIAFYRPTCHILTVSHNLKKHKIILDDYLHGYRKFIVFYLLIMSFFGSLNLLLNPTSLTDLLFGIILMIITYVLFVAMIGKKGLYISDNNFYRGIAIADKFLLKEKIEIAKFSEFTHKKKEKSDLPWFLEYSSFGYFSNHHECSVYLTKSDSEKRKNLISFSDFEMYYDTRRFLQRWTELKEQNEKK